MSRGFLGAPVNPGSDGLTGAWLVGFHGSVGLPHVGSVTGSDDTSICALALSNRSLGTQRMSLLTALPPRLAPSVVGDLEPSTSAVSFVVPRSTGGQLAVGRSLANVSQVSPPPLIVQVAPLTVDAETAVVPEVTVVPVAPAPVETPQPAVARTTPPAEHPWDAGREDLPAYLDRRLREAAWLYLPNRGRTYRIAKRSLDIVGSAILLLLTAPVMAVIALAIKWDSPGPAVFRQQRVTRGGQAFTFYKFRTMWSDARTRYPDLYDYNATEKTRDVYYKLDDDPRNTRLGRWLRRTTLDELPNLFNVLKGDMSLVGPRPELPELLGHYRAEDLALFFTRAGVTGLAQIAGRSLLTVEERITLDLRYVAQQTFLLDLRILVQTLLVVLLRRGAF